MIPHISKHSSGVLNPQTPSTQSDEVPERSSPMITVTPIQNLQNPNFFNLNNYESDRSSIAGTSGLSQSIDPTSPSLQQSSASPPPSSYADYVAAHHANLTAQLISQQSGIPLQYLYHNPSLIYQIHQHGLQIMQQNAMSSTIPTSPSIPQHPGKCK